ncbi:MAG TPA: DUF2723 domain-containing protein [Candidatus Sulfotelmatobacter sp.]|nr:DUF2723 domain-containing protein [Candidatus Sulfotelmatobacter sp.]
MDGTRRPTPWVALGVFLLAACIYLITLTPTVPFWDSGEFIAVSAILGIPHPPGTPFYVLIGRLASLVPIGSIAQRLNGLSAIASSLAAMITYLVNLRLIRLAMRRSRPAKASEKAGLTTPVVEAGGGTPLPYEQEWIAQIGAVLGAAMLLFSDNFWENAIEAEVYSMSSLAQIGTLWLGFKWWEAHDKRPTLAPMMLCVYVMWLCVGLHLSVAMMGFPLVILVWLVDQRAAIALSMPLLTVLTVTFGLERMIGVILLLSMATYLLYVFQRKLHWMVWLGAAVCAAVGLRPAFTDANFTAITGMISAVGVLGPLVFMFGRQREARVILLAIGLMVVGYSTHLYLPIRAAQHPAINEGAPSNWGALRDLLERKQYGQTSMFERRGPWSAQLDKEFWRYWKRQWPLTPSPALDETGSRRQEPKWFQFLLPMALGLVGCWWSRKDRISFLTMMGLFLFGTVLMIIFLNFTDHEVRDRDYFFTTGYHVYAIWIGMGIAWLIQWVRESFPDGAQRKWVTVGTAAMLALLPILVARSLWYTHDRRGNYVAHDYAYNMLAPLAPNSFIFTNGDNDTFPLWYIQQVENWRKDVRVVNMSLLNTGWYIKQLRDEEPKVPIRLTDQEVDESLDSGALKYIGHGRSPDIDSLVAMYARQGAGLSQEGYVITADGHPVYTNEAMVHNILSSARLPGGKWSKQPYFAVTVPEHAGLDKYFTLEGLVYRVNQDTLQDEVDEPVTSHSLYHVFKYGGLFNADGSWNTRVYKDDNAATLSRNYAAAHLQLAFWYRRHGEVGRGIAEMERVARMFPDYTEVLIPLGGFYMDAGDTTKALNLFQRLAEKNPGNPEARYYYGVTLLYRNRLEEGVQQFDAAIQIDPSYNLPYYGAYLALWDHGQRERSLSYLDRWVASHPTDNQARDLLESRRRELGGAKTPARLPQPTLPTLP